MKSIQLGSRTIQSGDRPYIIAEIGVNHEGSMDTARRLIDLAKEGGADAAKFQTYKAETLASRHSPAYWDTTKEPTQSQFELFKKHDSFREAEYVALAEHCKNVGIDFLSTPFDFEAVDFLEPLMPFYKIASADITAVPLLRTVARKGKPVVLSTGSATLAEIDAAINELRSSGCESILLLHCILNYPCVDENANVGMIRGLQRSYPELLVGYSDHTHPDPSMFVVTAAVSLGAVVIEKHFTHDKTLPGNDHYHAMDVDDLKRLVATLDRLRSVLGSEHKEPIESEGPSRMHARRSVVLARPLDAGATIAEADITFKRPAHGISPLHWDDVIGKKTIRALSPDHILRWSDIEL